MNKNFYKLFFAVAVMICTVFATTADAQRQRRAHSRNRSTTQNALDPLRSLPPSDAVIAVDLKRLLQDALPRIFASDPARLTEINAEIDRVRMMTGIDPRSFERAAVSIRFVTSGRIVKTDTVAIARGSFDAGAIVAMGRIASKNNFEEQKYKGKTVYVFRLDNQFKLFGLPGIRVSQLAVTTLDGNTLAFGDIEGVHATIDAGMNQRRNVNDELIGLATRNPNAVIGFGANLPRGVKQSLNIGNDELSKNLSYIQQVYGSVGTTASGFDLLAIARTQSQSQASYLRETLMGLKGLGNLYISSRLSGNKATLARKMLESLSITSQGRELVMKLDLPQGDIESLVRVF